MLLSDMVCVVFKNCKRPSKSQTLSSPIIVVLLCIALQLNLREPQLQQKQNLFRLESNKLCVRGNRVHFINYYAVNHVQFCLRDFQLD